MNNFALTITSRGRENLQKAFDLLPWNSFSGYRVDDHPEHHVQCLRLYWSKSAMDGYTPFLSPAPVSMARDQVFQWLHTADYGKEPDLDGHCDKGWTLTTELDGSSWSRDPYMALAVWPEWAEFHK